MTRNLTLRIDASVLRLARQSAVAEELSLSQWITQLITRNVQRLGQYQRAKRRATKRLQRGYSLGGTPLSRDTIHDR